MRYLKYLLILSLVSILFSESEGFTDETLAKIQDELPKVFDITFAFNKFVLGKTFLFFILNCSIKFFFYTRCR